MVRNGLNAANPCAAPHYAAPYWLRNPHLQTIWPLLRKGPMPPYRRERWTTPDRDFIDLDWIDGPPHAPLVVLFHGLEGSSRSHYARSLMRAVGVRRWRGVVVHFRGCSGEPNLLARAYHSGDSDEIDWVVRRLAALDGIRELYAVGVSLGGNALLKWLGEQNSAAAKLIHAACSVCPPLDLAAANDALSRGINRLYAVHFLRTLIPKSLAKLARFPGLYDAQRVRAARTLYEFDDVVTAPMHGFRDAADYYARASARQFLGDIATPTLLINAADDPFLPAHALPDRSVLSKDVLFECLPNGGHVGFVDGKFPGRTDWLAQRVLHYFEDVPNRTAAHPAHECRDSAMR